MDKRELRAIILKLEDRLSEDDRRRLHFFLRDDGPRRYIDDLSLRGTLNLIDSLFDQDIINENNFNFLINAFETIRCFDAVKLLKEYRDGMQPGTISQSLMSLSSIMPPMSDQFRLNQNDGIGSLKLVILTVPVSMNNCDEDVINDNNNMNVNPMEITVNNRTTLPSPRQQNSLFNTLFRAHQCLPGIILSLIVVIGILSGFTGLYANKIQRLTGEMKKQDDNMLQIQKKANVTRRLNELLKNRESRHDLRADALRYKQSEYQNEIKTLNDQLTDLQENHNTYPIKVGQKFGGPDGVYFYDSSLKNFTYYHYLNGIIISHDERNNKLESIQFLYRSSCHQRSSIKSEVHGNYQYKPENTETFILDDDERIYKVRGQITHLLDKSKYRKTLIRGIQFLTTRGRTIPPYKDEENEEIFFEQFNGYILGYVTGRSVGNVDQLQFYWYRIE